MTRKPQEEKWELLDNLSDILSETTKVHVEESCIVLESRIDGDANPMTVPIYELSEGK